MFDRLPFEKLSVRSVSRTVRYEWLLCRGKYGNMTCRFVPNKPPFNNAPNSEFSVRFPLWLLSVLLIHMRTDKIEGVSMNQLLTENKHALLLSIVLTGVSV